MWFGSHVRTLGRMKAACSLARSILLLFLALPRRGWVCSALASGDWQHSEVKYNSRREYDCPR